MIASIRLTAFLDPRLPQRFWEKCFPEPNSGCWLWTAAQDDLGYGRIAWRVNKKLICRSAHKYAYEALVGPVESKLSLDHLCRTPSCVNPAHLEAVTQRENVLRGNAGAHERAKTHCAKGHPYNEENTYLTGERRYRQCRECSLIRYRKKRLAERQAVVEPQVTPTRRFRLCREVRTDAGIRTDALGLILHATSAEQAVTNARQLFGHYGALVAYPEEN
jgi:hypothetical protein